MRFIYRCGAAYDQGAALGIIGLVGSVVLLPVGWVVSKIRHYIWFMVFFWLVNITVSLLVIWLYHKGHVHGFFAASAFFSGSIVGAVYSIINAFARTDDTESAEMILLVIVLNLSIGLMMVMVMKKSEHILTSLGLL